MRVRSATAFFGPKDELGARLQCSKQSRRMERKAMDHFAAGFRIVSVRCGGPPAIDTTSAEFCQWLEASTGATGHNHGWAVLRVMAAGKLEKFLSMAEPWLEGA